jgi:SET domain-containing protein
MKEQVSIIEGRIYFLIRVAKSKIHGQGVYSKEIIPNRKKIGSLSGVIISKKEARKKAKSLQSVSIVELWNGAALDATTVYNELKFINHSCQPNTFMRNLGNHVEFYALKQIREGDELTCNYGPTHHDGKKECRCGAPGCKGFI